MAKKRLGMRVLETQVMGVLWNASSAVTPREVHEKLSSDRDIAYTTVMTVLVRLWRKKMVRRRAAGRAYAYYPSQSRAEYAAARMQEILKDSGDHAEALASFIDAIGPKDRSQLRKLLGGSPKR